MAENRLSGPEEADSSVESGMSLSPPNSPSSTDTAPDLSSVGRCIRYLRERWGMTQRELGRLSGVHHDTIMRIEQGDQPFSSTLAKIGKVFRVDPMVMVRRVHKEHFAVCDLDMGKVVIAPNPKNTRVLPDYSQEALQDDAERQRIGHLKLVSRFERCLGTYLLDSTMTPTLLELYEEGPIGKHFGEELVYAVRGNARIRLGDESFVVTEGGSASFWPEIEHSYAPADPVGPKDLPPLLLCVIIDTRPGHSPRSKHPSSDTEPPEQ